MKKTIYVLILLLVVVSGLVFANREKASEKSTPKPVTEKKGPSKKWLDTPDGILFKKWEASPDGKKVHAAIAKINKSVSNNTTMEGVVTSLALPAGSRVGFGVMVRINDADYILSFGLLKSDEFQQLKSLKVNDKILLKSHSVSYAPKYSYPIVAGDYIERDSKVIYKRVPIKGGC
jgi:hypothetical protein